MRQRTLPVSDGSADDSGGRPAADIASARLRPGFDIDLPVLADEAILRLREGLDAPGLRDSSMAAGRYVDLLVPESRSKVWSPRLTIRVEDAPDGSILRCRYSPRPDVWTGFMFVYSLTVFAILFGATLGYVQQVSDETPWGYWAVPVGVLVIAGIHLAGYVGQRLAAGQMGELRDKLDTVLTRQFGTTGAASAPDQRS